MVQRTYIADIHFNTILNMVDHDPNDQSNGKLLSEASIWIPDKRIENVDSSKQLRADLQSFGYRRSLVVGAFVLCHGRFWCTKEGGDVIVHVKAFDNYPLPGVTVADTDSVARCPQLQTAFVTIIGLAGAKQEPTNQSDSPRSFELKTSVYRPGESVQFEVQCFFPSNKLFKNTPTPNQDELCSVTRTIVGTYTKSQNLGVLIDEIAYLSPGNSDTATAPISPPVTPSRRGRVIEWTGRTP